ncbi:MAG: SBBP repeat-containing protein [Deinococcales bacterium]
MRRFNALTRFFGAAMLLLGSASVAHADGAGPSPRWTARFGTDVADHATGVAAAPGGGGVIAGYTDGSFPGQTSAGGSDVFVAAFDDTGAQRWLRQFGGKGADRATAVALDAQRNAYVSGYTNGRMPEGSSVGAGDAFLAKLGPDGSLLWLRQFGTTGADYARGVAVDASGNVFVGGDTNGTLPENVSAGGDGDAFLAKYDASGDLVWLRQFGSAGSDRINGVATDAEGNVLATGVTQGALPTNHARGQSDGFVAKFDGNGTRVWLRQFGSEEADYAYALAAGPDGASYVTGYTYGSLPGNANSGNLDGYLARFDANGNLSWLRQFGNDGVVFGYAVAVEPAGNVLLGGWTNLDQLGPSGTVGAWHAYTARFDRQGQIVGLHEFGASSMEKEVGLAVDRAGNAYVTTSGILPAAGQTGRPPGGADDVLLLSYPP